MSEKITSLLAAFAVTFVTFAATSPASAKDRSVTVTATEGRVPVRFVSYRDLNLVNGKDERILVRRVRYAARDVCIESAPSEPFRSTMFLSCRAEAWQGARPQIDRAIERAKDIAANGWSAIAPVAITISVR